MMPPPGMPRPDAVTQRGFVSWLEDELDRAALAHPDPGRTETFHRLNRTEYKNAIRDLLALDIAVDELLPPDDSGYGFDNNAGVLRLSQSLMERYLLASRKISRWALGIAPPAAVADTFGLSSDQQQYDRGEGLPFGTRGGIMVPYALPRDGEYIIRAEFSCALVAAAGCDGSTNFDDDHQLEVAIGRRARAPVRAAVDGARGRVWRRDECPWGCRETRPTCVGRSACRWRPGCGRSRWPSCASRHMKRRIFLACGSPRHRTKGTWSRGAWDLPAAPEEHHDPWPVCSDRGSG